MNEPIENILNTKWDAIVIGAGNAGLCAAITYAQKGGKLLIIESAPQHMRGGNTRHVRNIRSMHKGPTKWLNECYPEEEYMEDLLKVTKGVTNPDLADMVIKQSADLPYFYEEQNIEFQSALSGTLNLERTNIFFLGGGRAMLNQLCHQASLLGVIFLYDSEVTNIHIKDKHYVGLDFTYENKKHQLSSSVLIAASGGFEANLDWLEEGWGQAIHNFAVRGTPYNQGKVLKSLLAQGIKKIGEVDQCHAVAIDARAPKYDGGIASRLDAVPFSVVLNKNGDRFYDEGEDFWPKRYAIWGRLVAAQPDQIAYAIIDSDSLHRFMPSVFDALVSDTIEGLAVKLGLDPEKVKNTIQNYNNACSNQPIDQKILDQISTKNLNPNKTNWAASISKSPFYGYPLKPGITFTYMGVGVNEKAQVLTQNNDVIDNLFSAGEMMAGNILGQGYLGGIGMTIGGVFGRIAGKEAYNVGQH